MSHQLIGMVEEERLLRLSFSNSYGQHLPSDLCHAIGNLPTAWEIHPSGSTLLNESSSAADSQIGHDSTRILDGEPDEFVPHIDAWLINEVSICFASLDIC
jgi:hypothetical protein